MLYETLRCRSYTLKVADKQFVITPEMVEVKRFTKTIHGQLAAKILVFTEHICLTTFWYR